MFFDWDYFAFFEWFPFYYSLFLRFYLNFAYICHVFTTIRVSFPRGVRHLRFGSEGEFAPLFLCSAVYGICSGFVRDAFGFWLDLMILPIYLRFCRISALDLWSLATEGTQEFCSINKCEFVNTSDSKNRHNNQIFFCLFLANEIILYLCDIS